MPQGRFNLYGMNSRGFNYYATTNVVVEAEISASSDMNMVWPVMRRGLSNDRPSASGRFNQHGFNVSGFGRSPSPYDIRMLGRSTSSLDVNRRVLQQWDMESQALLDVQTNKAFPVDINLDGWSEIDFYGNRKTQQEFEFVNESSLGIDYRLIRGISRDQPDRNGRFNLHGFNSHRPGAAPLGYGIKIAGQSDLALHSNKYVRFGVDYSAVCSFEWQHHFKRLLQSGMGGVSNVETEFHKMVSQSADLDALAVAGLVCNLHRSVGAGLNAHSQKEIFLNMAHSQYVDITANALCEAVGYRFMELQAVADAFAEKDVSVVIKKDFGADLEAEAGFEYVYRLYREMSQDYAPQSNMEAGFVRRRLQAASLNSLAYLDWNNGRLFQINEDMPGMAQIVHIPSFKRYSGADLDAEAGLSWLYVLHRGLANDFESISAGFNQLGFNAARPGMQPVNINQIRIDSRSELTEKFSLYRNLQPEFDGYSDMQAGAWRLVGIGQDMPAYAMSDFLLSRLRRFGGELSALSELDWAYALHRGLANDFESISAGFNQLRFNAARPGMQPVNINQINIGGNSDYVVSPGLMRGIVSDCEANASLKWNNGRWISIGNEMPGVAYMDCDIKKMLSLVSTMPAIAILDLIPTWHISVYNTNIVKVNPRDTYITSLDKGV